MPRRHHAREARHPAQADAIYLDEIRKAGLYDAIWQAFAVLLPVQTVGVMGDGRTYDRSARCAPSPRRRHDGGFYPFDMSFLGRVATRIINEVAASTAWSTT
jgi:GMP synthase (glutamine-hydrolysing)